jgi:hypothetical protein
MYAPFQAALSRNKRERTHPSRSVPRQVERSSVTLDDDALRHREYKRARTHTKDDSCEPAGMSDAYHEVAIFSDALDKFAFFDEPRRFMFGWEATAWIVKNGSPPHPSLRWLKVDHPATARLKPQCVSFDALLNEVSGVVMVSRTHTSKDTDDLVVLLFRRSEESPLEPHKDVLATGTLVLPPSFVSSATSKQLACFHTTEAAMAHVSTIESPPGFVWHTMPLKDLRNLPTLPAPFSLDMLEHFLEL